MENDSRTQLNQMRRDILVMTQKSGEGHIPSSFSILDILWVLYSKNLNYDSNNPEWNDRDRFVLSKGHGSLALYAVLAAKGFFPISELEGFCDFGSRLGGHPDRTKIPGIEASTGSLGHGFPQAVGIAIALKIKKNPASIYTLIGDGECNEGTIWESALLASNYKLENLVCILDFNHSNDRALNLGDLYAKLVSFGWSVHEIDGHDHLEIENALKARTTKMPTFIIAHTIKGKGIATMENNPEWHHKVPTEENMAKFVKELT